MTVLLDTHALVWWKAGGDRLSRAAARAIERADVVLVSPLSCWEVAALHRQGRLRLDREPVVWVRDLLRSERVAVADLTPEAAAWAGTLGDEFPGDPIDRLLCATAQDLRVPMITKDERLREYALRSRLITTVW